jgi:polysaccharide biosynthesis transport protein
VRISKFEDRGLAGPVREAWEQPPPDLRRLLVDLWQRRVPLVAASILSFSALAAVVLTRQPTWEAEAQIAIDEQPQVVGIENGLTLLDEGALETEIQALRSRDIIEEVIADLALYTDPDFNPSLRPRHLIELAKRRLAEVVGSWLPPHEQAVEDPGVARIRVFDAFLSGLRTEQVGRSHVIAVKLASTSRTRVAEAVNALLDHYLAGQTAARRDMMRRISADIEAYVGVLEERVRHSEQALERFRAESGLTVGRDGSVLSQRLVDLTEELARATADRAAAESRLAGHRKGDTTELAIPEALRSEYIQSMLAEESMLAAQAGELAKRYGERHPAMIEVRGKLAALRVRVEGEMARIEASLQAEALSARAREQAIRDAITEQENEVAERSDNDARLRQLERTAAADRMLLEGLQSRGRELGTAALFSRPNARVIARAQTPLEPAGPSSILLLALALPTSLAIGVAAAFATLVLDRAPRHLTQLETATGVPVTSAIPRMPSRRSLLAERWMWRSNRQASAAHPAPTTLILDAMRDVHATLILEGGEQKQAVLFTSSVPDEGKTTAAIAFAQMLVCYGRKVLLIDADLRQPVAHRCLGLSGRPGLGELLADTCSLKQAIQHDPATGISFVAAGATYIDVSHFGRDGSFARLLECAKRDYDLLVIDSAPVLSATESRLLARLADRTVFLVRWSRTPIDAAQRGLRLLADSGANLAGVTLSMVKIGDLAHYHYSSRYARLHSSGAQS